LRISWNLAKTLVIEVFGLTANSWLVPESGLVTLTVNRVAGAGAGPGAGAGSGADAGAGV
jgi:hypothetical protein